MDEEDVLLFEIHFGSADGVKVGEFVGEGDPTPVYLIMSEIELADSWGNEEMDQLLGMQEGLNVVIASLEEADSFKSQAY